MNGTEDYDFKSNIKKEKMTRDFKFDVDLSGEDHNRYSRHSVKHQKMPYSTLDDFEPLSTIGCGSYGTCKKIRRKKDGKIYAWKEMDYGSMTESEKQMLVSEVNLLRELRHKHIVRYYDRIIDRSNTTIYIIMEFCDGGDLATLISKCRKDGIYMEEQFVWKMLIQMTLALQECHRRKNGKAVLHRDLKPANIFLDIDKNVKLGDFGLARVLHHETSFAKTYVGTPYYMSPELVNNMSYNEKSDIWSMGCMLYELCSLHPPFTASNQSELNKKICMGEFNRIPIRYSSDLNEVIAKLLRVEVHRRPGIEGILRDPRIQRQQQLLERQLSSSRESESSKSSEDIGVREKRIDAKEKELESREKEITRKEIELEEKLKKLDQLMKEYKRKGSCIDVNSAGDAVADLSIDNPVSSCLSKGKKDPDTPKKKVSFDMYGKENLRQRDQRVSELLSKYSEPETYDSLYTQELVKRHELKDRLFKAKLKALEIRGLDYDVRPKSKNLLHFR
ncbi:serine/threonine-protein kinase Nek2-like isoform X1 [Mytilus californianus]|uniref:serine/threonine-protein kinase Nek2-like isoform X1 n=2 Tax=Mytilus californianus TaxID=6549 RepID=UPI002247FFAF|nr:serine/threonine-protein kinase Nek2-like isoform X1 [Mytilus californianus]